MGIAVDFKGTNITFTAPEGNQEVRSLKAYTNGSTVVQCWQFTKEELEEIQRTGKVFITLLCGVNLPPLFIGTEEDVRSVVADYGTVW